jgi:hypothetical protein
MLTRKKQEVCNEKAEYPGNGYFKVDYIALCLKGLDEVLDQKPFFCLSAFGVTIDSLQMSK